jgi:cytochrome c
MTMRSILDMYCRHYTILTLVCVLAAAGCKRGAVEALPQRGADPWVFRSTLDERPHMLTLALRRDLWVSYDARSASLYRVASERVDLDGAVYNKLHGPQPRSHGEPYFSGAFEQPWHVVHGREELRPEVHYRGHRFESGHVVLAYDLQTPGGTLIAIEERPEASVDAQGRLGLSRVFTHAALPADTRVILDFNAPELASHDDIELTAKTPELSGKLTLRATEPTSLQILLPPPRKAAPAPERMRTAESLIAANDCATCHNPTSRAVGPSYQEIAHYYRTTQETIAGIALKIRQGGAEQWGDVAMVAHPDLAPADAELIAKYVLTHFDPDDSHGKDGAHPQGRDARQQSELDATKLQPGIAIEVFELGQPSAATLPLLDPETRPNAVFVAETLDLDRDFRRSEPSTSMLVRARGWLQITDEAEYDFRIDHDGMVAMSIDDQPLLRDDATRERRRSPWVSATLKPGLRRVEVSFMSSAPEPHLTLSWVPPGSREAPVPAEHWKALPIESGQRASGLKGYQLERGVPGDGRKLEHVHPSFALQSLRPRAFKPLVGGMDFLPDGRLALSTWDARGAVYLLDVKQSDPEQIKPLRFAQGLSEPLGVKVVDGDIFVMQKHELTRLVDRDHDDVADDYLTVSNAWGATANFHEFAFGLVYRDEHFYATLATAVAPGGNAASVQNRDRGKLLRIDRHTGAVELVARGFRTPNGVGFGPDDALFVTDNEGDWLPANKLIHVQPGAFYGSYTADPEHTKDLPVTPPAVWLPVDEVASSPSQPLRLDIGPYRNQLLYGDVTYGGLSRVVLQPSGDTYQGCVLPFTQGLEAGINRTVIGPDGAIYVGGIGNPGNWAQPGKLWYGLQRLTYTGAPVFDMLDVKLRADGIELTFTEPMRVGDATQISDYALEQWRYIATSNYGGPKVDTQAVAVDSVHVSPDRRRVFIATRGMLTGHVVRVRILSPPAAESGRELWSNSSWCTLNQLPTETGDRFDNDAYAPNTLSRAEVATGWQLLFDGKTLHGWRPFRGQALADKWRVRNGALSTRGTSGPDLVTEETFQDFELAYEWNAATAANSGVFYRASEQRPELWQNAIEMQVLDDQHAADRHVPAHRAGSAYDVYAPRVAVARSAGDYNHARIVAHGTHVEHWLNGHKVVEYDTRSAEWKRQLASSKLAAFPDVSELRAGHIGLQHHGSEVAFRNIKLRRLDAAR